LQYLFKYKKAIVIVISIKVIIIISSRATGTDLLARQVWRITGEDGITPSPLFLSTCKQKLGNSS